MTRFLLICGVVLLHTPPFVGLTEVGSDPFEIFRAYFQLGFFRISVPLLSVISGYLLFQSELDKRPAELLKKKGRTIVLPFLLWNLPLTAFFYYMQSQGRLATSSEWLPSADLVTWLDAMVALHHEPVNYPLEFMRDLFLCMVAAIFLSKAVRARPLVTTLAIAYLMLFNLDGYLFSRDDAATCFFAGGALAAARIDVRMLDKYAIELMVVLLLACAAYLYVGEIRHLLLLRFLGVICLWPFTAVLIQTRLGQWMARMGDSSFWLFASHAPLMALLWQAWRAVWSDGGPYPVFWVLAAPTTILISLATYEATVRLSPWLAELLTGGRSGRLFGAGKKKRERALDTAAV